jgi:hypothetical protein
LMALASIPRLSQRAMGVSLLLSRHGRACPGHPRLVFDVSKS